jgi:hypothetical protein
MAAAPVVIFGEEGFGPEVVEAMDLAFRQVCEQLGLVEADDLVTRLVAEKIIHYVRAGVCDAERLCAYVLKELSGHGI